MSEEIDFSDITRDDILKAFIKYDEMKINNQLNNHRQAKDYLLFWNSQEYPHKYIVGIAYSLKYNQEPLDNTYYNSTGHHKRSAQWCIEKNGFILYADKKYKEYLQKKYDNQKTIDTYYSDLKKAIKIFQNIEKLKNKDLNEIFKSMSNSDVSFEEYDKSQKELGFNDKSLFNTLKTKAKTYLEAIKENNNTDKNQDGDDEMPKNPKQTQPLNQILYGPPGTGKTYNTINKALEVIYNCRENDILQKIQDDTNISQELKDIKDEREIVKKVFEYYKELGQIEFVTFHQSYGYEEFVEGIRADLGSGDIKYNRRS